jgi:hypothetical protein
MFLGHSTKRLILLGEPRERYRESSVGRRRIPRMSAASDAIRRFICRPRRQAGRGEVTGPPSRARISSGFTPARLGI